MNVPSLPESAAGDPQRRAGSPVRPATTRSRLRLATVGGIAAIAILGGGITAAAAASSTAPAGGSAVAAATDTPAPPSAVTSRLVLTGTAAPGSAAPGPAAPGTDGDIAAAPPAPKVHRPHLAGTVTSASGSTVLIKDREGFTRTVVESSTTTYRDGLKAALAVGSKIHAEGTVASNGTSLDATIIGADRGPGAGAPGDEGRGGPGGKGPGGHHAGPPKGTDAPESAPGGTGGTSTVPPAPSMSAPATTK